MTFPIKLDPAEEGGFVVSFPDIPEALTQAESEQEALDMGLDALITALDFYFEDQRPVPMPKAEPGQRTVELPLSVAAKVLLLNQMLASRIKPVELSRRMGVTKSDMTRILDLHHTTKIDTIAAAVRATGATLNVVVA